PRPRRPATGRRAPRSTTSSRAAAGRRSAKPGTTGRPAIVSWSRRWRRTGTRIARAIRPSCSRFRTDRCSQRWASTMRSADAKAPRWQGVIALLVTPFHEDYSLNEPALRAEIAWCFENGASGVVAAPSIGEFVHLSDDERTRCFEITREEASKHPGAVALAMTSGPDTLVAARLTRQARAMGFD